MRIIIYHFYSISLTNNFHSSFGSFKCFKRHFYLHARDTFCLCYGYSGGWGPAGALAPTHWIVSVLDYVVTIVPRNKIQVGIPFYGTDWPDNGGQVRSRSYRACQPLIALSTGGVTYEPSKGESHFQYTDSSGVGHTVWFSDAQSVAAKAALVKQYGVRGLSIWALGYGDGPVWDAVRSTLK